MAVLGYVFWKIAALFFSKWSALETAKLASSEKVESERTKTIAQGFADIVGELKTQGAVLKVITDAVVPYDAYSVSHRRA